MKVFNDNYQALNEKDEIRLLYLHPGMGSDKVKCTITHARLSSKPVYEALSYMWGDEVESRTILLDGRSRRIRENLWHTLCHLRNPDVFRVLWVDAICIDQTKDSERNHQVSQMGRIYSAAIRLCVWLGPSTSFSTHAINFHNYLSESNSIHRGDSTSIQSFIPLFDSKCSPWLDVARLADMPYWRRLWIIQEVSLAEYIIIYCGEENVTWDTLWCGITKTNFPGHYK